MCIRDRSKIEVPYSTENMAKAYEAFQEYCHSLGITGLTNINLSGIELIHAEALHNMDARGDLHLRQRFLVWGPVSYTHLSKRVASSSGVSGRSRSYASAKARACSARRADRSPSPASAR